MRSASRYNKLVTIERLTDTPDDQGGHTRTWAPVGQALVRAIQAGGSSALVAGTLQHAQPWRIDMPFRTNISQLDRLTATWLPAGWAISIDSVADQEGMGRELLIYGTASLV